VRGLVLFALLECGCGRFGFADQPDASDAFVVDAPPDALQIRDCAWTSNPTVGPLLHHSELAIANAETDPILVRGDPLTIYFARDVTGPQFDIYTARRPALDQPFAAPTPVTELATGAVNEVALQVESSGHAYVVLGPPYTIHELQADGNGVFKDVRALTELESGGDEYDPFLTNDGKSLYFTAGPPTNQDIYFATRAARADPWSNITPFQYNGAGPDGSASLTSDGLVIVWASAPNSTTPGDIYFAIRATPQAPWGPAQVLGPGTISGTTHDLEPGIRGDGCELFFSRSAAPSDGNWDIYSVTLQ
jgi:hypothetical protein